METFDNWYDQLRFELEMKGYYGPVDRDSAREAYDAGKTPEQEAEELYEELNS